MTTFGSFNALLQQEQRPVDEKHAVFTFGRFNPPTLGHQRLIEKTKQVAKQENADSFIFPSQTVDNHKKDPLKIKNPLPLDEKVKFMRVLFPDANIIADKSVKTPHDIIEWLANRGYTHVTFVVGGDREDEFQQRWLPYAQDVFQQAQVVSAGVRDPDAEDISGISATKARQAALEGDIGKFRAASGWDGEVAKYLMQTVKNHML